MNLFFIGIDKCRPFLTGFNLFGDIVVEDGSG